LKTIDMHTYSPKEPTPAIQCILDALATQHGETWNLIYLLLPVERKYVFTVDRRFKEVPTACWKTTHCDIVTGQFLNPYEHRTDRHRTVATLLRGPAEDFVDWATNTPAATKLPIHQVLPDWVTTVQGRLGKCAGYKPAPELTDVSQASNLLAKFKM
jgi:hypothetical protein